MPLVIHEVPTVESLPNISFSSFLCIRHGGRALTSYWKRSLSQRMDSDSPSQAKQAIEPSESTSANSLPVPLISSSKLWPSLPTTTGNYWTGIADFEWADAPFEAGEVAGKVPPPRCPSYRALTNCLFKQIEPGILVRLYYPAGLKSSGTLKAPTCSWYARILREWPPERISTDELAF